MRLSLLSLFSSALVASAASLTSLPITFNDISGTLSKGNKPDDPVRYFAFLLFLTLTLRCYPPPFALFHLYVEVYMLYHHVPRLTSLRL